MPLRILLVEDQRILQQLLEGMLAQHAGMEVVGLAATAAEGIQQCATLSPDLLILDMALPDGDGLSVAHALHVLNPKAKVIILSSFASTVERPQGLRTAIVAILDKNRAYQDLLCEVKALIPPEERPNQETPLDLSLLTNREREVLQEIGAGKSSKMIADQLCISVRTVETHRRSICHKFGLSGAALVHKATLLAQR